jgi:hypothetical protein
MLNLERILKQDRLLRAMTGLNRKAFKALLPSFTEAYERRLFNAPQGRQRAPGGRRKATLRTMKEKLFLLQMLSDVCFAECVVSL